MEAFLINLFGQGKDLNTLQMCSRGTIVFLVALALIRIAGRRSFGLRMPLDNIITILLGAILSRAVVGASPFLPVVICSFVIVSLHRFLSWLIIKSERLGRIIEGKKFLLFDNGVFIKNEMEKGLTSQEDIMQGVRKSALTEDMTQIEKVYMERNGDISPLKN
jgi:uncharacterized membrane protein YcaP (DUF421 family)